MCVCVLSQADILQPKLLGILVHFDNHLNNGAVPLEDKKAVGTGVTPPADLGKLCLYVIRIAI